MVLENGYARCRPWVRARPVFLVCKPGACLRVVKHSDAWVKCWVFHFVGDMELPESPGGPRI